MAVDTVGDGEEALALAAAAAYDVIVLDVMLPSRDGFSVARSLREKKMRSPILMLTGRGAVEDRVHGLDVGADDYLVKPFALRELIARIKALSRRHLPDRAAVLNAGGLSLDTMAHRLTVGRARGGPGPDRRSGDRAGAQRAERWQPRPSHTRPPGSGRTSRRPARRRR